MANDKQKQTQDGKTLKKIKPINPTEKLRHANWEFLKRNKRQFEALKKEYKRLHEIWLEYTESNLTINTHGLSVDNMHLLVEARQCFSVKKNSFKEFIMEKQPPAVQYVRPDFDDLFTVYPYHELRDCLIVACDKNRPKKDIMVEFEILLDAALLNHGSKSELSLLEDWGISKIDVTNRRRRWLSNPDELLKVWDLYLDAGQQSAIKTFAQIARKVGRPVSTVKDQWRLAYGKIYGQPYKPESKFTTEAKQWEAIALCAKCKEPTCYSDNHGEQEHCAAYLKLRGKVRKLKTTPFNDAIDYE